MFRRIFLVLLETIGLRTSRAEGQEGQTLQLPFPPVPENAAALSGKAVDAVRNVDGISLDYTPESLAKVDEVILRFRKDGQTMAEVGSTIFALGCYVGEVFVQNDGARWVMPDAEAQRVGFTMMGLRTSDGKFLNPIGKAMKLLKNGQEDSVMYFYSAFHSPSVRQ